MSTFDILISVFGAFVCIFSVAAATYAHLLRKRDWMEYIKEQQKQPK